MHFRVHCNCHMQVCLIKIIGLFGMDIIHLHTSKIQRLLDNNHDNWGKNNDSVMTRKYGNFNEWGIHKLTIYAANEAQFILS